MTFSAIWFAPWFLWLAWVLLIVFFTVNWRIFKLLAHQPKPLSWVVSVSILALLWLMNVQIEGGVLHGMSYHLLALNFITLLLGAPLALCLGCIALFCLGIIQQGADFLPVFALNACCILFPTIGLNVILRYWTMRKLPHNLFIYIFINGFISGALGMLSTGLLITVLFNETKVLPSDVAWGSVFPVFFLLSWGEAFLSGVGTAICVAFKPDLLSTFDDTVYLGKHNQIWK